MRACMWFVCTHDGVCRALVCLFLLLLLLMSMCLQPQGSMIVASLHPNETVIRT